MSDRLVADMRGRLRGRDKQQLIEGMISRSPHLVATGRLVTALEVFPLVFLMLAHDYPTKIWVLDRGERVSSAEILTQRILHRRWHSSAIGVDECEGLTDVAPGYVAVVTSWRTLLVMRHEFAHAVTTFFSPSLREQLHQLFAEAKARGRFVEPLAGESIGEYIACGLSYYFFADLRAELRSVDSGLFRLVERFLTQAEDLSARMVGADQSVGATP